MIEGPVVHVTCHLACIEGKVLSYVILKGIHSSTNNVSLCRNKFDTIHNEIIILDI